MYHADNDFGYEPTSEDLQDWRDSETIPEPDPDSDPFVSLTKEGPFWTPVSVFARKSGKRLELDSKQYAELVNSQR